MFKIKFKLVVLTAFLIAHNILIAQHSGCLKLSENKFTWMVNNQLDSLKNILHESVIYTHSNGWIQNKKEIIDDFQSGKLKLNNVLIKEAKEIIVDNVSTISGKGIFEGKINGTDFSLDLIYTEVYLRQNEKWYLISRHACKQ